MARRFYCPACRNIWATKRDSGLCCATKVPAVPLAVKRGYSREFTPRTDRRIKIEIDRVPPTLADALKAKVKREGVSIRALTLGLWKKWTDDEA